MSQGKPVVLLLGPSRDAVSGVSTHLNLLFSSALSKQFCLRHFQVGSEGRGEVMATRLVRLLFSPFMLAVRLLISRTRIIHINTSLNARAFWRDLAYLVVARLCGVRVVYQVHGGALPQSFFSGKRLLTSLLRKALTLPDAVVVLAQVELQAYRRFVPEQRVVLLPNGIDCAAFQCAEPPRFRDPELRLLYIGRLEKVKGVYEMLDAMRLIRSQGVAATLTIAGAGPEEAGLENRVRQLRLEKDVRFCGPVFGEDKVRLLDQADVFVLASYAEGLPYALLESLAAGLPVIVTPVGAIPDIVREGVHGVIVQAQNALALAAAITSLHGNRDLLARMGAAGRRLVSDRYSITRLVDDFARLYLELLRNKPLKAFGRPTP